LDTRVAHSSGPSGQNGQRTDAAAGQHLGWSKQADGGRNIGGDCPMQP